MRRMTPPANGMRLRHNKVGLASDRIGSIPCLAPAHRSSPSRFHRAGLRRDADHSVEGSTLTMDTGDAEPPRKRSNRCVDVGVSRRIWDAELVGAGDPRTSGVVARVPGKSGLLSTTTSFGPWAERDEVRPFCRPYTSQQRALADAAAAVVALESGWGTGDETDERDELVASA